ncbi:MULTISPECIES: hypothetical protein [Clostridia]|uniref:Uncharacterized protein n=1 Tax=Jingyaoa shaoxingensis TaxID=2763671 RepID=A0ABR7NDX0_9FIRM|nr:MULTISPECIES: hypothetical protein [Clostridia]MBC8574616.1 hypothetical protein [Jingyaoa shaoxingensis]MBP0063890.1 hypothetical protein [Anaerobutyricum hallii]MBS6411931.1 hypothetical protein [Tannerella sp.]MDB8774676.1 hypothetical protein [Ruminococcus sp. 1001136sp1]
MKPDSDSCQRSISSLPQSCRHDLSIVIMILPYSLSPCDDVAPLAKGTAG